MQTIFFSNKDRNLKILSNLARVVHKTRCRWSCMSVYEKCSYLAIYIKRKRWVIAHEHLEDKIEKIEKWERYDRVRATHVDAEEKIETRSDSIIIKIKHILSECEAFWSKEDKTKLFLISSSDLLSRSSLRKEKQKQKRFLNQTFYVNKSQHVQKETMLLREKRFDKIVDCYM
jgi:hypothetical protein